MIKGEIVVKKQNSKVCFNPSCPTPMDRIFHREHPHAFNIVCMNWILDVKEYDFQLIEDRNDIVFNFGGASFKKNINSCQLINSINLEIYFDLLQNQLIKAYTQQLKSLFHSIALKHQSIPAKEILQSIKSLSDCLDDPNTHEKVDYLVQNYLKSWEDKQITFKIPLTDEFRSDIAKLSELQWKFYDEKSNQIDQQRPIITPEEGMKIKEYIFHDDSASYNKLQEISSLCGLKMNNIQINDRRVKIQCPFCQYVEELKPGKKNGLLIKNLKKQTSTSLLYHCYLEHSNLFIEGILSKVSTQDNKDKKREMSYKVCCQNIAKHKKLRIIDRESGIPYKTPPSDAYCVQILSKPNEQMSKIRHILVEDRKITQFLIYFMIVDLCYIRKMMNIWDITLDSKACTIERAKQIGKILSEINFQKKVIESQPQKPKLMSIKQGNNKNILKSEIILQEKQPSQDDDRFIVKSQF